MNEARNSLDSTDIRCMSVRTHSISGNRVRRLSTSTRVHSTIVYILVTDGTNKNPHCDEWVY